MRPNQVWTWDISKLATYVPGVFLNLYLVLDLFSRYPVAWMIAEHENSALSKQLFAEAITRYKLEPGSITVHNDRGAPMTASGFVDMLAQLGVERSKSRPRVSNDNPFSESCFKTIKYQPDYPGRFQDVAHARRWFVEFFAWYADHHRHSGLALFTPADVFFGRIGELAETRQRALDAAYAAHAERFVRGRPVVRLPPAKVAINPIDPGAVTQTLADALCATIDNASPISITTPTPSTPIPVLPGITSAAPLSTANCS
jgi:putative transposase